VHLIKKKGEGPSSSEDQEVHRRLAMLFQLSPLLVVQCSPTGTLSPCKNCVAPHYPKRKQIDEILDNCIKQLV
jgi:hypothetical protein